MLANFYSFISDLSLGHIQNLINGTFLSIGIFTVHSCKTMPPKEQSNLNDFNTIGMPSPIGPRVFRNRASRIRNWFLRIIKNSRTMF